MPCETAIVEDVFTVSPDMNVDEALHFIQEKEIRAVPVVDENRRMVGLLSLSVLLKNLLPVSVTMEEGLQKLDFLMGAGPGIAKRLRKIKKQTVADVMTQDAVVLHPTTPIWEAIRLLVKYGSPLPVVDEESRKLLGIISEQSALKDLHQILQEIEENESE
jgi:CBS-domain-containing membrane protein